MNNMKLEDFLEAGFVFNTEDPITPLTYSLGDPDYDYAEDDMDMPCISFSREMGSFVIIDPLGNCIYFNANSPKDAIEWANRVTSFEPNY